MPTVEVTGVGNIEFPDSMSTEEIGKVLDETFGDHQQKLSIGQDFRRFGVNVLGGALDIASVFPDVVAMGASKIRQTVNGQGSEYSDYQTHPWHRMAEWTRHLADPLNPEGEERPPGFEGFLTDTMAHQVANVGSFLVGGSAVGKVAGRLLGAGTETAASLRALAEVKDIVHASEITFGAAMGAVQTFNDAQAHGASDEDAWKAALLGAGIASTQAIPIANWLTRNDSSGVLRRAIADGSIFGVQQFLMTAANNAVAKKFYDPLRPWLEGAVQEGAGGATVGTIGSLLLSMVSRKAPIAPSTQPKPPNEKAADLRATADKVEAEGNPATASALRRHADLLEGEEPTFEERFPQGSEDEIGGEIPPTEPVVEGGQKDTGKPGGAPPAEEPTLATPERTLTPEESEVQRAREAAAKFVTPQDMEELAKEPPVSQTKEGVPITGDISSVGETGGEKATVVAEVSAAVDKANAELGAGIDRVHIQTVEGSGVGSAPSVEPGVLVVDPARIAKAKDRGLSIQDAVDEELLHNAVGKALKSEWEAAGKPGTFEEFHDQAYREIANEMSPKAKSETEKTYGSHLQDDVALASEYMRQLLQRNYRGRVTEDSYANLEKPTRVRQVLKSLLKSLAGESKPGQAAQKMIERTNKLLNQEFREPRETKQSKKVEISKASTAPSPEPVVPQTAPAPVETPAQKGEAPKQPDLGDWLVGAYHKIHAMAEEIPGMGPADKDQIASHMQDVIFRAAEKWHTEHGSMEGFSLNTVAKSALTDGIRAALADKRGAGKTTSLDAVVGEEDAPLAETIADENAGVDASREERLKATQEVLSRLAPDVRQLLLMKEDRGAMAAEAKRKGVSRAAITAQVKAAEQAFLREVVKDPRLSEIFPEAKLRKAANPPGQLPELKARELTGFEKFVRFFAISKHDMQSYLREVANTAEDAGAKDILRFIAKAITNYRPMEMRLSGKLEEPFKAFENRVSREHFEKVSAEVERFRRVSEARDGGLTQAASWANAMTHVYPRLSRDARTLIDLQRAQGVSRGAVMTKYDVLVRDVVKDKNGHWHTIYRKFVDLGEKYFPRRLSADIQDIILQGDIGENRPKYWALMDELAAHWPHRFTDLIEADKCFKEAISGPYTRGDFNAGIDLARGEKLPDSWYDYSLQGYIEGIQPWARRMSQIANFGQDIPGGPGRKERRNAFKIAQMEATRQGGSEGLKAKLSQIEAMVFDSHAKELGSAVPQALKSIATVRYLTSFMFHMRNVVSSRVNAAENLGFRNTFIASVKGLVEASQAGVRSLKLGHWVEPAFYEDAAAAGAVQRHLSSNDLYQMGLPEKKWTSKLFDSAMLVQNLLESWNRGTTAGAAKLWAIDAIRSYTKDPNSKSTKRFAAQLQRWEFSQSEIRQFFRGDQEVANRAVARAVREKEYGYWLDQMSPIFRQKSLFMFTQFLSWGAMRQRDLARNLLVPAFAGEKVGGETVRNIAPLMRWVIGSIAGAQAVYWTKSALFGEEDKRQSWEEVWKTLDENQKRGAVVGVQKFFIDMTAMGSMGLFADNFRSTLDAIYQGRRKDFANTPGAQIVKDVQELITRSNERGYDPKGFMRDFIDIFIRSTPLLRETEHATQKWFVPGSTTSLIHVAQEDVGIARSLLRRWSVEMGRDDKLRKSGAGYTLSPNSESFREVHDLVAIGDAVAAGKLINELTKDRSDGEMLKRLRSSLKNSSPLSLATHFSPQDREEFMKWVERRSPGNSDRVRTVVKRYFDTLAAVNML